MIEYEYLPVSVQDQLEEIADTNEFDVTEAETIYNGIRSATGTNEKLAFLYEVPIELVEEIKAINLLSKKKDFILSMYESNQDIVMKIMSTVTDEKTIDNIDEKSLTSIFNQLQKYGNGSK